MIARQKVREGKLVKVDADCDDVVKNIRITGDFFLHPEETLEMIEKSMLGLEKNASTEIITLKIQRVVEASDTQMIGLSSESLAQVIKEALG